MVQERTSFGRETSRFLRVMQDDDAAEVQRMLDAGFELNRQDAYVEDGTPWATVVRYYYRGDYFLRSKTDYDLLSIHIAEARSRGNSTFLVMLCAIRRQARCACYWGVVRRRISSVTASICW